MSQPSLKMLEIELLHGTTRARAMQIEADFAFHPGNDSVFFVLKSNRDIAEHFARRAASRDGGEPALIMATVEDLLFSSLRKQGDATLVEFDKDDDVFLRSRTQWRVTRRAVEILNPRWIDMEIEVLPKAR